MLKLCKQCSTEKPISEFWNKEQSKDGKHHCCIPCAKDNNSKYFHKNRKREYARRKKWVDDNPEKRKESSRKYRLKTEYGLTPEQYQEMYDKQGGVCSICSEKCTAQFNLAVDHNHDTGSVRELLCKSCNVALGFLKDSSEVAEKAAKYLRRFGC